VSAALDDHRLWLTHQSDHTGIWLWCSCSWRQYLGWLASPSDAWAAEQKHLRTEAERDSLYDTLYPKATDAP
jgi:hypothetical protein